MVYGVHLATETMGPELMKEVVRFHKRQARASLLAEQEPVRWREETLGLGGGG
jgi:hypothetical protein